MDLGLLTFFNPWFPKLFSSLADGFVFRRVYRLKRSCLSSDLLLRFSIALKILFKLYIYSNLFKELLALHIGFRKVLQFLDYQISHTLYVTFWILFLITMPSLQTIIFGFTLGTIFGSDLLSHFFKDIFLIGSLPILICFRIIYHVVGKNFEKKSLFRLTPLGSLSYSILQTWLLDLILSLIFFNILCSYNCVVHVLKIIEECKWRLISWILKFSGEGNIWIVI